MGGGDSDATLSSIGDDENGSDGVDVVLNFGHNATIILLTIGETRRVEDAELQERSRIANMFTNAGTYHDTVLARDFVKTRRVGLVLVVRATLLIGTVEDVEIVMINVIAGNDIGDEFQN